MRTGSDHPGTRGGRRNTMCSLRSRRRTRAVSSASRQNGPPGTLSEDSATAGAVHGHAPSARASPALSSRADLVADAEDLLRGGAAPRPIHKLRIVRTSEQAIRKAPREHSEKSAATRMFRKRGMRSPSAMGPGRGPVYGSRRRLSLSVLTPRERRMRPATTGGRRVRAAPPPHPGRRAWTRPARSERRRRAAPPA